MNGKKYMGYSGTGGRKMILDKTEEKWESY